MLADPELDAIVIATPVVTHYELAKQALLAGKHVFVEKPPAQSSAEAEELSALAQENGLVLMPGYLLLYHPAVGDARSSCRRRASSATSSTCTAIARTSARSGATRTRSGRSARTTCR